MGELTGSEKVVVFLSEAPWVQLVTLDEIKQFVLSGPPPPDPAGPWDPLTHDAERVVKAFMQEDLADGLVTEWMSRGVKPRMATGTATKLVNGVQFAESDKLAWQSDNDTPWLHRWWAAAVRLDGDPGAATVPVLLVNGHGGPWRRHPYVRFTNGNLVSVIGGTTDKELSAPSVAGYNLVIGYRSGGQYYARINGQQLGPVPFTGMLANHDTAFNSMIGSNPQAATLPVPLIVDSIMIGHSELTAALVDRLEGWLAWRVSRVDLLPPEHPYKTAPPQSGQEPPDERFMFDQAAWDVWVVTPGEQKTVNRGNPPPPAEGYMITFRDDFTAMSVVDDVSDHATANWFAPTHLAGIGVDAETLKVTASPACYIHDAVNGWLILRMQQSTPGGNKWVTGAFSSVNKEGQGRTWTKGRFRIRCRFPALPAPRPGFFPAFWTYDGQHLFWRTRNRLELDFMEYDGLNGKFINTTSHIHTAPIMYEAPGIRQNPDLSEKIASGEIWFDIYDGQFHTWEFRIEDDYSYIIADDLEVARMRTQSWLTVPKYILVDWALRKNQGQPASGQTYDMTIDWIEVQERGATLAYKANPVRFDGKTNLLLTEPTEQTKA